MFRLTQIFLYFCRTWCHKDGM